MSDEFAVQWQGASKMGKTQAENAGRRPRPMSHLPIGVQFLCSLAWMPAASAMSFQETLLGTTEALMLTWAKRRHETLQEAVDVLAKACRSGDDAEWSAVCGNRWSHNMERFAADIGDLSNHRTRVYRSSFEVDDHARLNWH